MEEQQVTLTESICYHCGDELPSATYTLDNKQFCCIGCQSVYKILASNNLCAYYDYNATPGKQIQKQGHFAYLDEPEIIRQLIDYQDDKKTIITFYIPAIHCSSCIWLLEHIYKINKSIFNSRIDFLKKQVTVSFYNSEISLRQVVEILSNIGYEPSINQQDVVKEQSQSVNKALIQKIAVSGFLMGNVMLFCFPEYFGFSSFEKQFQHLFGWLNIAFSIPAVFYCGKDYLISALNSLKHKVINLDTPLALIIVVLFLRTCFEVITATGPGFADTLTGLIFLLLMGKWVKQRTYHHISFDRDYRSYFPIAVTTLQNGKEKPIAINELTIGHRILIRNNEIIPADAILMKGDAWIDMSFVTGESEPVHKVLGEVLYAGGRQTAEALELEVIKPVSQSYLTSLWNKDHYKTNNNSQNFNDSIAKYFSIAVFVIAFVASSYWFAQHNSAKAWSAFTAVIIVACPCVLALSTPFTLSAILSVFDKKGFYVKNTDTVERLATCDTVIFDKTGTLTSTESSTLSFSESLNAEQKKVIASLVRNSTHPLSRHILQKLACNSFYDVQNYQELPGKGISGTINEQNVFIGNNTFLPKNTLKLKETNGVSVVINDEYIGYFAIKQEWRHGLKQLLTTLFKHFNLHLLSGDTDKDLNTISAIFPETNVQMHFRQSPHNKLNYILNLQSKNHKVIMLGDGLNDAGALKQSDVGIAVTDNVNNFSPGCDAILTGKNLSLLPQFIQLSKQGLKIIKASFLIATSYNLIGIYFAVQGTLYPLVAAVLMPISTITIILFTTISTRFFAKRNKLT